MQELRPRREQSRPKPPVATLESQAPARIIRGPAPQPEAPTDLVAEVTAEGEVQYATPVDEHSTRDENGQLWLDCSAIVANPYQPRQTFEEAEIADLADSIRTHGILQPLVVRHPAEGYPRIAGERRLSRPWRAAPRSRPRATTAIRACPRTPLPPAPNRAARAEY